MQKAASQHVATAALFNQLVVIRFYAKFRLETIPSGLSFVFLTAVVFFRPRNAIFRVGRFFGRPAR